jgi:hypothetical protein
MTLDAESKRRVAEWLTSKLGLDPVCRMCNGGPLVAMNISLLPSIIIDFGGDTIDGQAVVNLQCINCGYFHLFDARAMGVSLPFA